MYQDATKHTFKRVFILCLAALTPLFAAPILAQTSPDAQMTENSIDNTALAGGSAARDLFLQAKKYHDGDGVKQDFSKARTLYIEAAELESNDARLNLGYLYFMGQGVKQDYVQARKWYEKAAENGSRDACTNLAMIYANGLGVEKSAQRASYWRDYRATKSTEILRIKADMPKNEKVVATPVTNQTPEQVKEEPLKPAVIKTVQIKPKTNVIVKSDALRKPTIMLRKNTAQRTIAPVWMSNALIGVLLALALLSSIWFVQQYIKLRNQKQTRAFIRSFYAHHRDRLRTNYLRYPIEDRSYGHIDDLWSVALCVLMVKFAEKQQDSQDAVGQQSRQIVKALKLGSMTARRAVYPFVERVQQKVLADIYANDCAPEQTFKPIQFPQKLRQKPELVTLHSNVVNLHPGREHPKTTIEDKSLWPDTTGA